MQKRKDREESAETAKRNTKGAQRAVNGSVITCYDHVYESAKIAAAQILPTFTLRIPLQANAKYNHTKKNRADTCTRHVMKDVPESG